jgi:hypothetical protein
MSPTSNAPSWMYRVQSATVRGTAASSSSETVYRALSLVGCKWLHMLTLRQTSVRIVPCPEVNVVDAEQILIFSIF